MAIIYVPDQLVTEAADVHAEQHEFRESVEGRDWFAEALQYVDGRRTALPSPEHVIAALRAWAWECRRANLERRRAATFKAACDDRDVAIAALAKGEQLRSLSHE